MFSGISGSVGNISEPGVPGSVTVNIPVFVEASTAWRGFCPGLK